jgi:hypothetical protein
MSDPKKPTRKSRPVDPAAEKWVEQIKARLAHLEAALPDLDGVAVTWICAVAPIVDQLACELLARVTRKRARTRKPGDTK